jgi:hypothetical protein
VCNLKKQNYPRDVGIQRECSHRPAAAATTKLFISAN